MNQEIVDTVISFRGRLLDDGIYNIEGVKREVFNFSFTELVDYAQEIYGERDPNRDPKFFSPRQRVEIYEKAIGVLNQWEDAWIGCAYETYQLVICETKPDWWEGKAYGSSFNYGATVVLTDCPRELLILAQND